MDMSDVKSEFLRLAKNDFVKGLATAAFGAAFGAVYVGVQAGAFLTTEVLGGAGKAAILAGMSYISRKLLTNSDGKLLTREK